MGISKRHLNPNSEPVPFDVAELGEAIKKAAPDVIFALLMGSARDGIIPPHGDLDLALYLKDRRDYAIVGRVEEAARSIVDEEVRIDIGILNGAEAVYRFEALKGRLLFTRDQEVWLDFYSLACREYETQMASYRRQRRYRLERSMV